MSDEKSGIKGLREILKKENKNAGDASSEEWDSLKFSEKQKAIFLHVFKHYDFTVVDALLSNIDDLKEAEITADQVLSAWEDGKRKGSKKDVSEDV